MAPIIGRKATKAVVKKKAVTFVIDCAKPVEDKIMDIGALHHDCSSRREAAGGDRAHSSTAARRCDAQFRRQAGG
jgi:hypothetical protein